MKLLLIDGNSLINRSFYAIRLLSNKAGVYTNAITGFFSTLLKLRKNLEPDHIAVAFDLRAPTFRHEIFEGYKKSRKGMPDELATQMPYIKEILDYMGIARVESAGFEADDIIGTLAKAATGECYIATGDRDAFQLISDNVSVVLHSTKGEVIYTPEKIQEMYGIRPEQFIDVKALMGDKSDDIPGIDKIGDKTAFPLIQNHGSIDYIYENLHNLELTPSTKKKIELGKEICYISRDLAAIATNAPIELSMDAYKIGEGDSHKLAEILTVLEMPALMKRLKLKPVELSEEIKAKQEALLPIDEELNEVLLAMENVGVALDSAGMRYLSERVLQPKLLELNKKINNMIEDDLREHHTQLGLFDEDDYDEPQEVNFSSPKQVSDLLFGKLGLTPGRKTSTGMYSTDNDVLETLRDEHPIVPLLIEQRELFKYESTYFQGLLKRIHGDRRLHTTFRNETRTGRISSVDPNLQNIPTGAVMGHNFREFFVPGEGMIFVGADYSQVELRVLAHMSGDPVMLKAFTDGADIHVSTASQVFGVDEKAVTREMREAAKAVNFGIVYGMGAFSLSKEIGVSVSQAHEYIERYFEKYAGVRDFLNKTVEDAKANGYVKTLLGRTRYIPEINSSNKNTVAAGERIAKNTPIQGTAADIIKIAMVRVHNRFNQPVGFKSPACRLILQVHDELLAETPEDSGERVAVILKEEMLAAGEELGVKLAVNVKTGGTWHDVR